MEDLGDTEVTESWTFCKDCGLWFDTPRDEALHTCELEVVISRAVGRFEHVLRRWLKTPAGHFAVFLAEREK